MKTGNANEGAQQRLVVADGIDCELRLHQKVVQFKWSEVGQRGDLGVALDQLDRIEFRSVGWLQVGADMAMRGQPSGDWLHVMGAQTVPDQGDRHAEGAAQLLEEGEDRVSIVVNVGQHTEVGTRAMTPRRDRQYPDGPDFAPRATPLLQLRGVAARRPRAPVQRPITNPASSMKTIAAQAGGVSLLAVRLRAPSGGWMDGGLIAFERVADRQLRTLAQLVQQSPNVIDVIVDAKTPPHQFRYPWTGPQIGVEASGLRTFEQQRFQPSFVRSSKLRPSSLRRLGLHSCFASPSCRCLPAAHAPSVNIDAPPPRAAARHRATPARAGAGAPVPLGFRSVASATSNRIIGYCLSRNQ